MRSTKKGLFLVITSGIVFGVMPGAVTFCYSRGANPLLMLLLKYLMLTAVLFPIVVKQRNTWALYRRNWLKLLVLSLVGVGTPLQLYSAYSLLPTGVVTTIHFFTRRLSRSCACLYSVKDCRSSSWYAFCCAYPECFLCWIPPGRH